MGNGAGPFYWDERRAVDEDDDYTISFASESGKNCDPPAFFTVLVLYVLTLVLCMVIAMVLTNFNGVGVGFGFGVGCGFGVGWGFGGMPLNFLGIGAGGGCGVGLGLGWGFGSAFGSKYISSAVTFPGVEFSRKNPIDEMSCKDISRNTNQQRSKQ